MEKLIWKIEKFDNFEKNVNLKLPTAIKEAAQDALPVQSSEANWIGHGKTLGYGNYKLQIIGKIWHFTKISPRFLYVYKFNLISFFSIRELWRVCLQQLVVLVNWLMDWLHWCGYSMD